MRTTILFVVLLGLTVVAGLLIRSDGTASLPTDVEAVESPTATPTRSADAARGVAEEFASSSMRCRIEGRVVDGDGAVLLGANIAIRSTRRRTACGPDGRFAFAGVSAQASAATLEVSHSGKATLVRAVTLWPDALVDVGDLVLLPGSRIHGKVVDEYDRPVEGARVRAGTVSATSGTDGLFELAGLTADEYHVRAAKQGYAGRPVAVTLEAGDCEAGVELRLDAARVLSGRLVTKDGTAIPGASVEARLSGEEAALTIASDGAGRFRLAPLPSGKVQLLVKHPTYLPFGRVYKTDSRDLVITLTPTRAILGQVVSARGGTIPIQRVQLLVSSETDKGPWRCLGAPIEPVTEDAAAGKFRLPLGIHTTARVVAFSDGHAPAVSDPFWMGPATTRSIVIRANVGVRLRGQLRDDRGLPVPGADVRVLAPLGEGSLVQTGAALALAANKSDASGAFESTPLAPGRYRVSVRRPGYVQVNADVVVEAKATSPVQIEVSRAGTIRGCVDHSSTRLRVVATRVDAATGGALRLPSAMVRDGAFGFEALEPGRYRLQLRSLAKDTNQGSPSAIIEVSVGQESFVELGV